MSTVSFANQFSAAGFEEFLQRRIEPKWMSELRREAWNHASAMEWPSKRHEEWLRTDQRLFNLNKFSLPDGQSRTTSTSMQLLEGVELGGQVLSVDSTVISESLDPELAAKGVIFGSLDRLSVSQSDLVRKYLFSIYDTDYDKYAALHAAFFSGGQFLYVPRGVCVDKPFHLGSVLSPGATDLTHTLIVLDEGAEATILHEHASETNADSGLHLGAVELIQHPNSHARYVNLQEWNLKTFHFAHQKARVDRNATLQWTIAAMGAGLAKVNQTVELVGRGADCQVNGVMFSEARQHLAYHTLQHHVAPECHSDFLYKSAQQDQSRTVWRGMIKVDKNAQKTDGYQRNDNLVLSTRSRADSIPGLEIEADDVRCTHGSTTAKVDEELIFYAGCRGFTRDEAVRMIVIGFFQQIFDRITIESVRDALGRSIARQVRNYE